MFLYLSKLLPLFFYPLGLGVVLVAAAAVLIRLKWLRAAQVLCVTAMALLWGFSAPFTSQALLSSLEGQYLPVPIDQVPQAEAIVVLGGALRTPNARRTQVELTEASDRILHAARLFKAEKAPLVLMSGGNIVFLSEPDWPPESVSMAGLARELGVPAGVILVETRSQNTFENAEMSRAVLAPKGIRRILLVTSALHMPRSVAIFKKAGFEVIPASTDFQSGEKLDLLLQWLPSAESLFYSQMALKEWVGLLVYRLRGWA